MRRAMGGTKFKKHTAASLNNKVRDALENRGGGKDGLNDRKGGAAGHAKFQCPICKQQAPDLKSMKMHFDSKHPKESFDESSCVNMHALHGATTVGVAVKGSAKKSKK